MASVPYRGRPGIASDSFTRRKEVGGREEGAGTARTTAIIFSVCHGAGKEGKKKKREKERSGYEATEDHTGVPADPSRSGRVSTCTALRWLLNADAGY